MMRINQHFRCIRDIINSWLPFFFWKGTNPPPKTPSVFVMFAELFPGAAEVTCFFFSPSCFSPPSFDWRTSPPSKEGKKGGFRSHSFMERWSLQLSVFAGKTQRSSLAGSTGLPAVFWGEEKKPRVPGQKCRRHTLMRCPALIVLTKSKVLSILLSLQVSCVCEGQVWCTLQDSTRSSSSTKQLCASTAHSLFCPFFLLCRQIETY